jgi:hypothetical protein
MDKLYERGGLDELENLSNTQEIQLFIDALVGIGTGNLEVSVALAEQGLARFSGNQHRDHWEWNIGVLGELELDTLKELYAGLCNLRRSTESLTPTGVIQ